MNMNKLLCMMKASTQSPDLQRRPSHMASWRPTDYEASLIKKTWSDNFEDLHALGSMIYVYIFANNPQVKSLFPSIHKHGDDWQNSKEFHAQALKFAQVLASVIENIYRIEHVKQSLFSIGAKHVEFAKRGFRPEFWDIFQEGMAISMVEKINSIKEWDKFEKLAAINVWKNLALFIIENFKIGYSMKDNS